MFQRLKLKDHRRRHKLNKHLTKNSIGPKESVKSGLVRTTHDRTRDVLQIIVETRDG